MEKEIEKIENMSPFEYLNELNEVAKEKLIGICLNKKIIEFFEDGHSTEDDDIEEEQEEGEQSEFI